MVANGGTHATRAVEPLRWALARVVGSAFVVSSFLDIITYQIEPR
jgi:hypothetical protein